MKSYLRYFRVYFIIILVLALIWLGIKLFGRSETVYVRANTEYTTTERVFDYADKLTDTEEAQLATLIAEREAQTGCDIVLVTLNESLKEYAAGYADRIGNVPASQYVMVYADNFYDEHMFGFNKPHGDGVLLLDNWYREEDGNVYSWLSTCGRAMDRYSSSMIDSLLNEALEDVDTDPYGAYSKYINRFYADMTGEIDVYDSVPAIMLIAIALIVAVIYVVVNLSNNKGKDTTNINTYLAQSGPRVRNHSDVFIRRTVSRRKLPQNDSRSGSGGGGGGGHTSSGGVSHGGGGHSR